MRPPGTAPTTRRDGSVTHHVAHTRTSIQKRARNSRGRPPLEERMCAGERQLRHKTRLPGVFETPTAIYSHGTRIRHGASLTRRLVGWDRVVPLRFYFSQFKWCSIETITGNSKGDAHDITAWRHAFARHPGDLPHLPISRRCSPRIHYSFFFCARSIRCFQSSRNFLRQRFTVTAPRLSFTASAGLGLSCQ